MPSGNNTYLLTIFDTHTDAAKYWFGICQVWNGKIITLNEISKRGFTGTLTVDGLTISGIRINHVRAIKIGYYKNT